MQRTFRINSANREISSVIDFIPREDKIFVAHDKNEAFVISYESVEQVQRMCQIADEHCKVVLVSERELTMKESLQELERMGFVKEN